MKMYKCLNDKCGTLFQGHGGPQVCTKCGGLYVEWTDKNEKVPEKISPEQRQQEVASQMFKGIFEDDPPRA